MASETDDQRFVAENFVEHLAKVQTRLIDVLSGYHAMQEKAEPEIVPLINEYARTHTLHEQELATRLAGLGHKPDEDGSFFSLMQQAVVRTRALFTDMGTNALPQVIDGEVSLLEIYQETLMEARDPADKKLLERQMQKLRDLNQQARSLADA